MWDLMTASNLRLMPIARSIGVFVANFATAAITPAILEDNLRQGFRSMPLRVQLQVEDAVSAVFAFSLGYFIFRRWKFVSAKWVWIAGLAFFAVNLLSGRRNFASLCWEFSPRTCEFEAYSLLNWTNTIVLVRTIFYSLGAFTCSRCYEAEHIKQD